MSWDAGNLCCPPALDKNPIKARKSIKPINSDFIDLLIFLILLFLLPLLFLLVLLILLILLILLDSCRARVAEAFTGAQMLMIASLDPCAMLSCEQATHECSYLFHLMSIGSH